MSEKKKHSGFRYQPMVVFIFIFLNCLLSAGSFLIASPVKTAINTSCLPSQNHNTDQEESNHQNKLLNEQQEYHVILRTKQKLSTPVSAVKQSDHRFSIDKDTRTPHLPDTYLLIRPHYYTFLSLYHLF